MKDDLIPLIILIAVIPFSYLVYYVLREIERPKKHHNSGGQA